jgi:hypothetical protein
MNSFPRLVLIMGLFSILFGGCNKEQEPRRAVDPEITKFTPADQLSYSQLDFTEAFGDNERLGPEDWIATIPLNRNSQSGASHGLPPRDASDDDVYAIAAKLSKLRELIPVPNDGVYCPICHIANIQIEKLHKPCPKCGKPLLKFGWD